MTLTRPMRDTLEHAVRQELRRVHDDEPGRPAWPAHPSTLAALVRHGLLERRERKSKRGHQLDTWTVTQAGRDALKPREVFRRERPLYLSRGSVRFVKKPNGRWAVCNKEVSGDYTTDPQRSIDFDPRMGQVPSVHPEVLDTQWSRDAAIRHAESEERRARARRLATSTRRAA